MVSVVKKGKDRYSKREWVVSHRNIYNGGNYHKDAVNGMLETASGNNMFKRSIKKKLRKVKSVGLLDENKTNVRLSRNESDRIKNELGGVFVDEYLNVMSKVNNTISKIVKG